MKDLINKIFNRNKDPKTKVSNKVYSQPDFDHEERVKKAAEFVGERFGRAITKLSER